MFSNLIIAYLFLGGLGGGLCVISGLLALAIPSDLISAHAGSINGMRRVFFPTDCYRCFLVPSFVAAFIVLSLGVTCLIFDLGDINHAVYLFFYPHKTFLTFGSYILMFLICMTIVEALVWSIPSCFIPIGLVRFLSVLFIAAGLGVVTYTGLLLYSIVSVPFWTTISLPVLFVLSGLSCGCAAQIFLLFATGSEVSFLHIIKRLFGIDAVIIVCEIVTSIVFFATALTSPYEVSSYSAKMLLFGQYAPLLYGGFVICGLIMPFVFGLIARKREVFSRFLLMFAPACVLVGGFVMRYCITIVGIRPDVWTVVI